MSIEIKPVLAPDFVAMEIKEWIDRYPAVDKETKELFIELAKRIVSSYEYYRVQVRNV